jgi:murein endopeptidase
MKGLGAIILSDMTINTGLKFLIGLASKVIGADTKIVIGNDTKGMNGHLQDGMVLIDQGMIIGMVINFI